MKNFFLKKWILIIIIIIIIIICFLFFIFYNKEYFSKKLITVNSINNLETLITFNTSTEKNNINLPLYLKIPVIGVDATIEYVGLNSKGEMGVPKDSKNVAWFKLGPLPGSNGSAVIAGHFDDKNGKEAVFYNLKKIKKGDKLFIEDITGNNISFIVREVKIYNSKDFLPEVFISKEGQHLNLITCTGTWDKYNQEYTKRLIIFSDIINN